MVASTGGRHPRTARAKSVTVPGNLRRFCEQFNAGRFFESHESLEELWQEERGDVRDLYKGLIQAAAAFVHISRGCPKGATRLLRTSLEYLEPYRRGGAMGFELEGFCFQLSESLRGLENVGGLSAPVLRWDESRVASEAMRWGIWGFNEAGDALTMEITVLDRPGPGLAGEQASFAR